MNESSWKLMEKQINSEQRRERERERAREREREHFFVSYIINDYLSEGG